MMPFIERQDVNKFARHFTGQSHVFSEAWLLSLLKALGAASHVAVQAFAAFHFALAANLLCLKFRQENV